MIKTRMDLLSWKLTLYPEFSESLKNLTFEEDAPNENFSMLALLSQSYAIMPNSLSDVFWN